VGGDFSVMTIVSVWVILGIGADDAFIFLGPNLHNYTMRKSNDACTCAHTHTHTRC
jgi:hypothetical protein